MFRKFIFNTLIIIIFSNGSLAVEINSATTSAITNDDVTITSDGSITISSADAIAISGSGNGDKTINNAGTIDVSGQNNQAITSFNIGGHDITNSGTMSVSGVRTEAIRLSGSDSNTVTNTGSITTTGGYGGISYAQTNSNSNGITLYLSDSNTINNNSGGTISTTGDHAYGIDMEGSSSNTISNAGKITTSGTSAYGMRLIIGSDAGTTAANTNTITNSGNIEISGNNSAGLYLEESNSNTFTNTGTIKSTGNVAPGIHLKNSDSNTITNSGTIQILGSTPYAVHIEGNSASNTIILNSKNIVGEIFSESTQNNSLTIKDIYGNSSYFISTTGDWTITNNDSTKEIPNTTNGQVAVGKFKNVSELLFGRFENLNYFINSNRNFNKLDNVALYFNETTRNHSNSYDSLGINRSGFNFIKSLDYNKTELIVNVEESQITLDNYEHQDNQTSFLIGINFPQIQKINSTNINLKGLIGQTYHNTSHKIYTNKSTLGNNNGSVISKKKYLSNHYNLGIGSFTNLGNTDSNKSYLSLGMDVNNQLRESYSDDFFTYDSLDITQLESHAQFILEHDINNKTSTKLDLYLKNRNVMNGAEQNYKINSTNKKFVSDKSDTYYGAKFSLKLNHSENFFSQVSVNFQESNDKVSSFGGNINLNYKF